ncbi:hypothetical protein BSZ35_12710 [Salinibacter sp. 10B]|nr:hypothetical protein BSZ35_12710 [Salinibacter sp. 10B]
MGSLFVFLLLVAPVEAQSTVSAPPSPDRSTWQANYGEQAANLLRSDIEQKKHLALKTLLAISYGARPVDLSSTVPALFDLYESDATLEHRIMAATALRQVADRSANGDQIMQRLGALTAEQSSMRVQRLTLRVLADYEMKRGRTLQLTPDLYKLFMEQQDRA